jgi:hypothetical protein
VVGDARKQGAAGNIAEPCRHRPVAALAGQQRAQLDDRGIFIAFVEMQQDRAIGEIGQVAGKQRRDRREGAAIEQAGPEIVGAHLQAPFVLSDDRRRRFDDRVVVQRNIVRRVHAETVAAQLSQSIHERRPCHPL